jgi:hypothetical protein
MRLCLRGNKVRLLWDFGVDFSEYVLLATQPIFAEESGMKRMRFVEVELPLSCG